MHIIKNVLKRTEGASGTQKLDYSFRIEKCAVFNFAMITLDVSFVINYMPLCPTVLLLTNLIFPNVSLNLPDELDDILLDSLKKLNIAN